MATREELAIVRQNKLDAKYKAAFAEFNLYKYTLADQISRHVTSVNPVFVQNCAGIETQLFGSEHDTTFGAKVIVHVIGNVKFAINVYGQIGTDGKMHFDVEALWDIGNLWMFVREYRAARESSIMSKVDIAIKTLTKQYYVMQSMRKKYSYYHW